MHLVGFVIRIIVQVEYRRRYFSRAGSGQDIDHQNLPSGHAADSVTCQFTTDSEAEFTSLFICLCEAM